VEEERVVGLRGCLGDSESGRVRDAVAVADHEAVEAVVDVEVQPGIAVTIEASVGAARHEDDGAQLGPGGRQRLTNQARVAPLGPGANPLRGGEVEGVGLCADDSQRLQPELERRSRD
jgi:hypothetical protein